MTTYQEYKQQIADLKKKAADAREIEVNDAVAKIREIMKEFGLQLSDLGKDVGQKSKETRASVAPKYRDPSSGKEWTGRGRAPRWLDGKNKDDFLI